MCARFTTLAALCHSCVSSGTQPCRTLHPAPSLRSSLYDHSIESELYGTLLICKGAARQARARFSFVLEPIYSSEVLVRTCGAIADEAPMVVTLVRTLPTGCPALSRCSVYAACSRRAGDMMVDGGIPLEFLALVRPLGLSGLLAGKGDLLSGDSRSIQGAGRSRCWCSHRMGCRACGCARTSSTGPLS
ncbi:hypothetical protein BH23ACT11_BH23ACT11_12930 [soil metagenome]